ncbi:putative DMBT1-like protein [Apostichopus japonicus]|uniref:Putative DMBT1-like protein n=1 Tax=Stichopus japonicus TaxID=307972 RepID=A0A2G8KZA3_STIJA|nr:putative DMBT1-like protein [Apostichopus japonicus]
MLKKSRRHNCASNERAGVECLQSTDIRLMLGDQEDANMGFVEVSINGQWGKVCDDNWNMNSAAVACRQLGKRLAVWNTGLPDRYTDVQYVLDDLDCNGDETRLLDCGRRPLWRSNCGDGEAASVICT